MICLMIYIQNNKMKYRIETNHENKSIIFFLIEKD